MGDSNDEADNKDKDGDVSMTNPEEGESSMAAMTSAGVGAHLNKKFREMWDKHESLTVQSGQSSFHVEVLKI